MPIINAHNLSAYYENRKVFENVNFTVDDGDYLCIVGENGSGKTTLMKIILGMNIKHTGMVEFNGFGKKAIGWLPQKNAHQKDFPASVYEVVVSGFAGKTKGGIYRKEIKQRAIENMRILDISDISEKSFSELSGGQQQKVLLCRALCAAKKVLLLDEPVTGLDAASTQEMYSLINKLNDSGIAIIMISHDINRAVSESKHILHLGDDGVYFGTNREYIQRAKGDI